MDSFPSWQLALVLAVMQVVKQIPLFNPDPAGNRRFGWLLPWVSGVVGIGVMFVYMRCSEGPEADPWVAVLRGILIGLAASGLWEGGVNLGARAITKAITKTPLLLVFCVLNLLFAGGCQTATTTFRIDAATEVGEAILQIDLGVDEARAGLEARLAEDEIRLRAALSESLKMGTPADVDTKLAKYFAAKAVIDTDRARASERFRRMAAQSAYARQILARMIGIEQKAQGTQAQLDQFAEMAETLARQKLGLPAAAPAK